MILHNLPSNDRFSARLVCKQLADISPPTFYRLTVRQDHAGYQRLSRLPASGALSNVWHMTFAFQNYSTQAFTNIQFIKHMEDCEEDDWKSPAQIDCLHEMYQREHDFLIQLFEHNLDVALLTSALSRLTNLTSVSMVELEDYWLRTLELPDDFPSDQGEYVDVPVESSSRRGGDCKPRIPTDTRAARTLMAAFCAAGTKLKHLQVASSMDLIVELADCVAELRTFRQTLLANPIDCLTSLELKSLDAFTDGELAQLISSLPMLDTLTFSSPMDEVEHSFPSVLSEEFLSQLQVSRLKAVKFEYVCFPNSSCLVDFLFRHAKALRKLHMLDTVVETGSWRGIFVQLRQFSHIDCETGLSFYVLNEDLGAEEEISYRPDEHRLPALPPRAIEDYIARRTDINPFDRLQKRASHSSWEDTWQCQNGACPLAHPRRQVFSQIMERAKRTTDRGPTYALSHYELYVISALKRDTGYHAQADLLLKIAVQREPEGSLHRFRYHSTPLAIRHEQKKVITMYGWLRGQELNNEIYPARHSIEHLVMAIVA